jgi:Arc/MetJ-type ribon-helix-helix transcriptional regulator
MPEETHVTIKVPKELVAEMDELIGTHGFRSRGEITKEALRRLLADYKQKNLTAPEILPRFEQINHDENGVKIHDRKLHRVADVYIKPKGFWCELDQTDSCEHIDYAMTLPEVKETIRKRRKEGWKLDV